MSASFLNIDLEIESPEPLEYLALQLSEHEIHYLYCGESKGGHLATFECNQIGAISPDTLIDTFTQAIDSLDDRAKKLWSQAHRKTFDIGYEADAKPGNFRSEIRPETIAAISKVGASLILTIYPRPKI
ncbi:MAG: hypothetical protein AAGD25_32540 [Cyanobacteria bacterium P01_F01_bin.150]